MEVIPQTEFAGPSDPALLEGLDDEPLVVHQKPGVTNKRPLLIFVHGLRGHRYGEKSTWGDFPKFIYKDFPQTDGGLYEYRTLFRRAKFWESVPLPDEAEVLGGIIRDIKDYETIILMGHSMGGLLCMAAICYLITSNQKKVLSRLGGLILMATPQTGSQRVPRFLSWFSRDFYALKPHGEFVSHLHRTLENWAVLDESHASPDKHAIPTWAVLGASDFWVDKLSAGLQLPDSRKKLVRASHTAVVKPQSTQSDVYLFVHDCVRTCLERLTTQQKTPTELPRRHLSNELAFLRSLYSAADLRKVAEFDVQYVNTLGQSLGLSPEETFILVEQLRAKDLVKVQWGGRVSLTSKGRDCGEGKVGGVPEVYLGPGATYVGPGAQISASAIGPNAMAAGAIRIETGIGDLVAALQELRVTQPQLDLEAQKVARELEGEIDTALRETYKETPDKKTLRQRLDQAAELVERLDKFEDASNKLWQTIQRIGQGLEFIAKAAGLY